MTETAHPWVLTTYSAGMMGCPRPGMFAMRQFYAFFSPQFEVVPQPAGQMPWVHMRTLLA